MNDQKSFLVFTIVALVVYFRDELIESREIMLHEAILKKNKFANPRVIFSKALLDLQRKQISIPVLITDLFSKEDAKEYFHKELLIDKDLIRAIAEMANYFYDTVEYCIDTNYLTKHVIEVMIKNGQSPLLNSEKNFPFWRYHQRIFDNDIKANEVKTEELESSLEVLPRLLQ